MFMTGKGTTKQTGSLGERLAARYLKRRGFKILAMNWARPYGELDLVARSPQGVVTFVEVKSMKCDFSLMQKDRLYSIVPEENITSHKLKQLRRAAQGYIAENKISSEIQVDAIALDLDFSLKKFRVRHYENILVG